MYRLLQDAGIYRTSWTGEALSLAFNEGARNFGIRYLMSPVLEHCPQHLSKMQRENLKHERSDHSTSTSPGNGTSGSTSG